MSGIPVTAVASRLRTALGFPQLQPNAPELRLVHGWLDTWLSLYLVLDLGRW